MTRKFDIAQTAGKIIANAANITDLALQLGGNKTVRCPLVVYESPRGRVGKSGVRAEAAFRRGSD